MNELHENKLRISSNQLLDLLRISQKVTMVADQFDPLIGSIDEYGQSYCDSAAFFDLIKQLNKKMDSVKESMNELKQSLGSADMISVNIQDLVEILTDGPRAACQFKMKEPVSKDEAVETYKKVYERVVTTMRLFNNLDGYTLFIENTKKEVWNFNHIEQPDPQVCPYCSGAPRKIASDEFFNDRCVETSSHIWACSCGAYTVLENGQIHGSIANTELHTQRNLIKSMLEKMKDVFGMVELESLNWFSYIIKKDLSASSDIDYLTIEDCRALREAYAQERNRLLKRKSQYPASYDELCPFFLSGGRLQVINAYGLNHGQLLLPIQIGKNAFTLNSEKGIGKFLYPPNLEYQFTQNILKILHPNGAREKFQMHIADERL